MIAQNDESYNAAAGNNMDILQGLANQQPNGYGSGVPLSGGGGMPMGGGGMGGGGGPSTNPASYMPGLAAGAPLNGNGQNFLGSVFSSFQKAQDDANAANAARYGQVQSGYDQLGQNLAQNSSSLGNLYGQRTNDFGAGAARNLQGYGDLLGSQTQGYGNLMNGNQGAYGNLIGAQNQAYGGLMSGQGTAYDNLMKSQTGGLADVGQGYGSMLGAALNNMNLLGRTQANDLNEQYDRNAADSQQSLVNRGLYNTTVTDSVNRGINLDKERALTNLAQGVAKDTNNTLAQFGMPALQFGQQAVGANTALGQQAIGAGTQLGGQAIGANTALGQNSIQSGTQLGQSALQNEAAIAGQGLQQGANYLGQTAGLQGDALNFGAQAQQNQTQLGQNQLNFMQSINQTGPDFGQLADLAKQIGASGTVPGSNGYNNFPSTFPTQNPIGALPGANLSNPNYATPIRQQQQQQQVPQYTAF
jgi:hypothetical protein